MVKNSVQITKYFFILVRLFNFLFYKCMIWRNVLLILENKIGFLIEIFAHTDNTSFSVETFRIFLSTNCTFHYWHLFKNSLFFSGNYILNYLATRPKLPNFVIQALVTLFARISKLGWFDSDKDEYVFRNVVADVTKFLQVS